jgi:hypothetical protein
VNIVKATARYEDWLRTHASHVHLGNLDAVKSIRKHIKAASWLYVAAPDGGGRKW